MLRHVAVFTFRPKANDGDKEALAAALAALPGEVEGIHSYTFGPDRGLGASTADFALVADFDDADAFRAYAEHPTHERIRTELLTPILEQRTTAQFDVE